MLLFSLEPGDGTHYRFVFGRLPSTTLHIPFYTYFAYAEGYDALIGFPFDAAAVSFDTFASKLGSAQHTRLAGDPDHVLAGAWCVYAALVGADDEGMEVKLDWRVGWQAQLPTVLLG